MCSESQAIEPDRSRQHVAIVLAAGRSSRLGRAKQQLLLDGLSLETRAVQMAAQTAPAQLLLVRAEDDARALPERVGVPLLLVSAPAGGMGLSLRAGVAASDLQAAAYLVISVDLPGLDAAHLQALVAQWQLRPQQPVASAYAETVGMPAILPGHWRQRLLELHADHGARYWLRQQQDLTLIRNEALAADIDLPADLSLLGGR